MGLRLGILSTAAINDLIIPAATAAGIELAAVASRDTARAEAYAAEHGFARGHGAYRALLDDPDVDLVYISAPNTLHVEWTLRAIAAGKHVLVEKPLTRHAEEARAVVTAAEAAGVLVSEAFMWRHHPQTRRIAELVRDGAVGRPLVVRAAFAFALEGMRGIRDTRFDPDLDGGSLMDVGCYCVSAIRLLAGEPERVHAERILGPTGVDVAMTATLRMPGDVLGQFDCGFATPHRDELEVIGTEGSLYVDDPWHARAPGIEIRDADGGRTVVEIAVQDSYRLQLENMAAAIAGAAPLRVDGADAVGQARALEAIHRAAAEGVTVVPPPV
ncbi:MAG: Gfo/Idh/MocA family oxidoreductase [Thermoleophilia bacterium]|nr:Gfo/Idh/MocA family oxidoreductase [Thermoleophilia bacterium]